MEDRVQSIEFRVQMWMAAKQPSFLYYLILSAILILLLSPFVITPVHAEENNDFREELVDKLNTLRHHYGVKDLTMDKALSSAAQHQAEYLAEERKLDDEGPNGETVRDRAVDAGYGGDKSFTIHETNAMVWVDTDTDYLIEEVWRKSQQAVRVIFDPDVRQVGIGIADAPDKHRYIVLTLAGLDDGTDDYSITHPTYDYRTPKPTMSATPTPQPLVTSTRNPDGGVYHVVQSGETFSEIALAYGLDWYTLSVQNNITLSDTTPVVIREGQTLLIEPTYTFTPTPTATKTPVPPTITPRPTFTAGPGGVKPINTPAAVSQLPAPDFTQLLDRILSWKRPVGWLLIGLSIPGIYFSLRKK